MKAHQVVAQALERDKQRLAHGSSKATMEEEEEEEMFCFTSTSTLTASPRALPLKTSRTKTSNLRDFCSTLDAKKSEKASEPRHPDLVRSTERLLLIQRALKPASARFKRIDESIHISQYEAPQHSDEKAFVGQVLTSAPLMMKSSGLLKSFADHLYAESPEDSTGPSRGASSVTGGQRAADLLSAVTKLCHSLKVSTARTCWQDILRPSQAELRDIRTRYEALRKQFAEIRADYLKEITSLRDHVRVRADPEAHVFDSKSLDVTSFFDPMSLLSPEEMEFANKVVKEKVRMIFDVNPKVAQSIDASQVERLQHMAENQEIAHLRQRLQQKTTELAELKLVNAAQASVSRRSSLPSGKGGTGKSGASNADEAVDQALQAQVSDFQAKLWRAELAIKGKVDLIETLKQEQEHLSKELDEAREERRLMLIAHKQEKDELVAKLETGEDEKKTLSDSERYLRECLEEANRTNARLRQTILKRRNTRSSETDMDASESLMSSVASRSSMFTVDSKFNAKRSSKDLGNSESGLLPKFQVVEEALEEREHELTEALLARERVAMWAEELEAEVSRLEGCLLEETWSNLLIDAEASLDQVDGLSALVGCLNSDAELDAGENEINVPHSKQLHGKGRPKAMHRNLHRNMAPKQLDTAVESDLHKGDEHPGLRSPKRLPVAELEKNLGVLKSKLDSRVSQLQTAVEEANALKEQAKNDSGSGANRNGGETQTKLAESIMQMEKEVTELKKEKVYTEANILSAKIEDAMAVPLPQSHASAEAGEKKAPAVVEKVCKCGAVVSIPIPTTETQDNVADGTSERLRNALGELRYLLPSLLEMLRRLASDNANMKQAVCIQHGDMQQLVGALQALPEANTNPFLRQYLDSLRSNKHPNVFDRLYADHIKRRERAERRREILKVPRTLEPAPEPQPVDSTPPVLPSPLHLEPKMAPAPDPSLQPSSPHFSTELRAPPFAPLSPPTLTSPARRTSLKAFGKRRSAPMQSPSGQTLGDSQALLVIDSGSHSRTPSTDTRQGGVADSLQAAVQGSSPGSSGMADGEQHPASSSDHHPTPRKALPDLSGRHRRTSGPAGQERAPPAADMEGSRHRSVSPTMTVEPVRPHDSTRQTAWPSSPPHPGEPHSRHRPLSRVPSSPHAGHFQSSPHGGHLRSGHLAHRHGRPASASQAMSGGLPELKGSHVGVLS